MSLRFVWQNLLVLDGFWMPALIVNWSGAQVDPEATGSPCQLQGISAGGRKTGTSWLPSLWQLRPGSLRTGLCERPYPFPLCHFRVSRQ